MTGERGVIILRSGTTPWQEMHMSRSPCPTEVGREVGGCMDASDAAFFHHTDSRPRDHPTHAPCEPCARLLINFCLGLVISSACRPSFIQT